jgi:phage shock protein C
VLRRSRDDRVIGGVCGGLGRYLGIDPVVVRIAFVVLALGLGSGIFVYLIAFLVIPEELPGEPVDPRPRAGALSGPMVAGLVLIGLGAVMLTRLALPDVFAPRYAFPGLLILLGLVIVVQAARRR